MTLDEKTKMIMELMTACQQDAEHIDELLSKVNEFLSMQKTVIAAEKQSYSITNRRLIICCLK